MAEQPAQRRRAADGGVTLGELNRNVVQLSENLQTFMGEVRDTAMRRDVYRAEKAALELRIVQLEEAAEAAVARADANRRLAVSGLVLPLLVAVVAAVILAGIPH